MKRGYALDQKGFPKSVQIAALKAGGVKTIYEDDQLPGAIQALRGKDDVLWVHGLRGLATSREGVIAQLDKIHDKNGSAGDITTGRLSSGRDGAKLLSEAVAAFGNERRGPGSAAAKNGAIGGVASAKAYARGRMPIVQASLIWADKTLSNQEALERINGDPAYPKPYSLVTLYRQLGAREVMAGRRTPKTVAKAKVRQQKVSLRDGAVYFVRADGRGPVKIGFSTGADGRLKSLQTSHHGELAIIAAIPGTQESERSLHKHFAKLRLKGEWFKYQGELRRYIEGLPKYAK